MTKTVSLVLGSGGARGMAHIGVIRFLEEKGYTIQSISSCSVGAVVGGVYAAGELDAFEEWMRSITRFDVVRLLDVAWGKEGLFEGEKIIGVLRELVGDRLIEELPMSYTATAVDIQNEKEIWLKRGSLFAAMRASMSLPLFFTPYEVNGMKLLDGGILNPVPIAPTFEDDTDLTIAVNLGGPRIQEPEHAPPEPVIEKSVTIQDRISRFLDSFSGRESSGSWKMLDVADQTFDAMQSAIARQKLAAYPPDVTITIPRNACGTLELECSAELITMGYEMTEEALTV